MTVKNMGKIKARVLGDEEIEKKQKLEQKTNAAEKKKMKKTTDKAVEKESLPKEKPEKKVISTKEKSAPVVKLRGKNYISIKKLIDKTKNYQIEEAVGLLKKIKYVKFDESVELHLNVDKTGIKGEIELPFSTGKTTKVRIVDDKTIDELESGKINFDILITHPSFMPKLAKFAKVLGPKGLMPNPKAGTISTKPEEVAKKFEKGMLRWKTEPKAPIIHQMIGKLSFDDKKLVENTKAFVNAVGKAHIFKAFIKSTMSPSMKIDLEKV